MILSKPCSLQNLSQLQPTVKRWMGSLINISNTDCSKMYFVWNEVIGNFSSISMHVLFPLYRKRNYFTLVKHCNLVFQWRHGFLLTAWGELTDGNFSWYGERFSWYGERNAMPYEVTFGNIPDSQWQSWMYSQGPYCCAKVFDTGNSFISTLELTSWKAIISGWEFCSYKLRRLMCRLET